MKYKAIGRINSYNNGHLYLVFFDSAVKACVNGIVKTCQEKHGGYVKIEIQPPYKQRTTGKNSQNSKFYALVQDICNETGNDIDDVKDYLKEKAVRRGYPVKENPLTHKIKPYSTTKVNTVEMSYLIEEALQLCAELGIVTEDF